MTPTARCATWRQRCCFTSNGCSRFWKKKAWSRLTMQRNRSCARLCSGARSASATAAATVKSPLPAYSPWCRPARGRSATYWATSLRRSAATVVRLLRLRCSRRSLDHVNCYRPAVTKVVAWAASNGDRSENADYQYGKRRLRQIDGRIRFLTKRIDAAEVVDPESPSAGQAATRAFFGATVRSANAAGTERVVSIVGTDEVDLDRSHISWVSPLARALMKAAAGDRVVLLAPGGTAYLTVLEVCYERISVEPFREPPGPEALANGPPRAANPPDEF